MDPKSENSKKSLSRRVFAWLAAIVLAALAAWTTGLLNAILPEPKAFACNHLVTCEDTDTTVNKVRLPVSPNLNEGEIFWDPKKTYEFCFLDGDGNEFVSLLIDNSNRIPNEIPRQRVLKGTCKPFRVESGPNIGVFLDTQNGAKWAEFSYRFISE